MKLYRIQDQIVLEHDQKVYQLVHSDWDALINQYDLFQYLASQISALPSFDNSQWLSSQTLSAPIVSQEIWAAGVTYLRSKVARMEESKVSGGADFYAKVYEAERPEIFSNQRQPGLWVMAVMYSSEKIHNGMFRSLSLHCLPMPAVRSLAIQSEMI